MASTPRAGALRDAALADFADITPIRAGRQSTVYRGRELATGRVLALKVLDVADPSPRHVAAFDREATVLAALGTHPNIVTFHRRLRLSDGRPVLVLELCAGSLADRFPLAGALPAQEAVTIGIKIAGALATAHRGGVVHRDVRPQNILTTAFGEPALTDFGVATLQGSARGGSPLMEFATAHTAPELLEGAPATDATDVYGLASTLYELLAGAPAFRSYQGESTAAVCLRILSQPVAPLASGAVPLELSDVLLWAMARDPRERPPGAAWLAGELGRIVAHNGWPRTKLLIREPDRPVGSRRLRVRRPAA